MRYGTMSNGGDHDNGNHGAQGRAPTLDLFDLIAFVWTQLWLAVLVAVIVFIPLATLAFISIKPSYEATSRLLVRHDDSDLSPGAAGSGEAFILDQVMESEAEILNSDAVRRIALRNRGAAGTPDQVKILADGFKLSRAPNSSILVAQFDADTPESSANTLNALVEAYLAYRVEVLIGSAGGAIDGRLEAAEQEAEQAETALRDFLRQHRISDFETEMTSLLQQVGNLEARRLSAQADAASADQFAQSLTQNLRTIPEEIDLYVENDVTGQLLALEVEREALLARYQPSAPPVQAIERQIEALNRFIRNGGADGQGQTRTGVNPIWQELNQEKLRQESYRDSQTGLAEALGEQIRQIRRQVDRLRALKPEHDRLMRAARSRSENAQAVGLAAADASTRRSAAQGGADAVTVVERAVPPSEAKSIRGPALAAVFILACGCGIIVALLRGYWLSVRYDGPPRAPQGRRARQARQGKSNMPKRELPVLAKVGEY